VATLDELNAEMSKAVAAAIPSGLNLSAGGSLASMPQINYNPSLTPIPSLLQRLQDFREAAETQFLSLPTQNTIVEGRRNQHWREVAEYEKWVFPLYLYLENVDWHKVVAWHKARWHTGFINSLWLQMRDRGLGYVGRKILRDRLLSGSTYRIKLALPIPTPAEYAQRRLQEAQELYEKVFANRTSQEQVVASDGRRFLAEQLKRAAIHLGRREQSNTGRFKEWKPKWDLKQAVEPDAMRSQGYSYLAADELGKVLATVENFWQHWHAFHEAEKTGMDRPAVNTQVAVPFSLTHLHPILQQAAGSRFASAHYSDAVEKACIALEKAVRDKASQPSDLGGTDLMNRVFSQANPMLTLSPERGEREGYMFLFRGMWQALRNHHAHNDTATDPARALEWLSFISALFYKLDEAQPTAILPVP
jgi:uncharacterized protein (TIGR02391 family)